MPGMYTKRYETYGLMYNSVPIVSAAAAKQLCSIEHACSKRAYAWMSSPDGIKGCSDGYFLACLYISERYLRMEIRINSIDLSK